MSVIQFCIWQTARRLSYSHAQHSTIRFTVTVTRFCFINTPSLCVKSHHALCVIVSPSHRFCLMMSLRFSVRFSVTLSARPLQICHCTVLYTLRFFFFLVVIVVVILLRKHVAIFRGRLVIHQSFICHNITAHITASSHFLASPRHITSPRTHITVSSHFVTSLRRNISSYTHNSLITLCDITLS